MANHSVTLNCLFPDENMLLVFDWNYLNLSIYNPPQKEQQLLGGYNFQRGVLEKTKT